MSELAVPTRREGGRLASIVDSHVSLAIWLVQGDCLLENLAGRIVRTADEEREVALADTELIPVPFGVSHRAKSGLEPEVPGLPRCDLIEEEEILPLRPDDVSRPVGAVEARGDGSSA